MSNFGGVNAMKTKYESAFSEVLQLIQRENNDIRDFKEQWSKEINNSSVVYLGDYRYLQHSSFINTNEKRVSKVIEKIATDLAMSLHSGSFCLYPIREDYKKYHESEQIISRPFQLVLNDEGMKKGVVFSLSRDIGKYSRRFLNGEYDIDALIIVVLSVPTGEHYKVLITEVNEFNARTNPPTMIERTTIKEFWIKHFGIEEYNMLIEELNIFNQKAKEMVGFNTVAVPTEGAINKFKEKIGTEIINFDYEKNIPDTVYEKQIKIIKDNYFQRGLWKAMIGNAPYALSFITSEWYYTMYQLTENLDLTNVAAGYLKSIEQLLFAVIELSKGTGITIQSKEGIIEYTEDTEDVVYTTLHALEKVIDCNKKLLDVNRFAKQYLVDMLDEWREKHRNGYFHKDNLQSVKTLKEIRETAFQLYFLILGSCSIDEEQFEILGIE